MDWGKFKAPIIRPEQAWQKADLIRKEYWPSGQIPVDVEKILYKIGLKLEPISSLKNDIDVDALLSGDLTRIIVDAEEYMDDRKQNRMRFSIAHELGHYVLHKKLYEDIKITTVKEWIQFMESIPEDQYGYIEQQAYEFAGRLLVPFDRLEQEVRQAIIKAKKAGFTDWERSGDAAREYMANNICRVFGVSSQVIEKRITRERLPIK
jgi:hypothetical protein